MSKVCYVWGSSCLGFVCLGFVVSSFCLSRVGYGTAKISNFSNGLEFIFCVS